MYFLSETLPQWAKMAHRGSERAASPAVVLTALCGNVTRGGETCREFGVVANPLVEFFQGGGVVDVTVRLNSPYWFLLLVETSFEMRSPPSNLVFIWEGLTIPVPYTRRRDKTSSRPFSFWNAVVGSYVRRPPNKSQSTKQQERLFFKMVLKAFLLRMG